MKQIGTILILLFLGLTVNAQDKKYPDLDASPLDRATYPANAAWRNYLQGDDRNKMMTMRVTYSRPKKKGRTIFGELVPYGAEWRLGANEATEIAFYQPVGIGNHVVNGGMYSLSAEVNKDQWTFHFSSETSIWGNANRDKSKDVATISVPVQKTPNNHESLSMTFREINPQLVHLVVAWDDTQVEVPIALNPPVFTGDDISPMDQSVYPNQTAFRNYAEGDARNDMPKLKVVYGRPQMKGRKIFGDLLKYGNVWRVGANESTELTVYQDVKIGDQTLRRGTYAVYAVVNQDNWEFILSRDLPAWGDANRDESMDVLKYKVPSAPTTETVEALAIIFEGDEESVNMVVAWENTRAALPISF